MAVSSSTSCSSSNIICMGLLVAIVVDGGDHKEGNELFFVTAAAVLLSFMNRHTILKGLVAGLITIPEVTCSFMSRPDEYTQIL